MNRIITSRDDFNGEKSANALKACMEGTGVDEGEIIRILAVHDNEQRVEIATTFQIMYDQSITEELQEEVDEDFCELLAALMVPPREYDAKELRHAMEGPETDEAALIEIMCSRTNNEIQEIKDRYLSLYQRDLDDDLQGATSGFIRAFLRSQCDLTRQDGHEYDRTKAYEDAKTIYEAVEGNQWDTLEADVNDILCLRKYGHLRATFDYFKLIAGKEISTAIESKTRDVKKGIATIVRYAINPPAYFAERIHNSIKANAADDSILTRVMASRCDVDLNEIENVFCATYDKTLDRFIKDNSSGNYQRMLRALLGCGMNAG